MTDHQNSPTTAEDQQAFAALKKIFLDGVSTYEMETGLSVPRFPGYSMLSESEKDAAVLGYPTESLIELAAQAAATAVNEWIEAWQTTNPKVPIDQFVADAVRAIPRPTD